MKTQTSFLTVLTLCWCGIFYGQFYDDFESYTPGDPINKNWWDHGFCDGGPGCDLMASDAVVHSGEVAGFVPGDTTTDASLDLGNKIFGSWDFQFYLYIPSEKEGFLALMDVVPISSGIPIMGYFSFNPNLSNPGVGIISDSPLGPLNFSFPHEEWFLFEMYVDITLGIANATCMLAIDGEEILPSGTPFTDSNGTIPVSLGGIEFFSISNQNELYIDNVCYRSFGKGDFFWEWRSTQIISTLKLYPIL